MYTLIENGNNEEINSYNEKCVLKRNTEKCDYYVTEPGCMWSDGGDVCEWKDGVCVSGGSC
jgi:hypothetical protein